MTDVGLQTFELPQEPPISVAVIDNEGGEWTRIDDSSWSIEGFITNWGDLLYGYGPVTLKPLTTVILTSKMVDEFSDLMLEIQSSKHPSPIPDYRAIHAVALEVCGIRVIHP